MRNTLFDKKDIPKELRNYFDEIDVKCGAPWERVVETRYPKGVGGSWSGKDKSGKGSHVDPLNHYKSGWRGTAESKTIGWQPTCKCDADTIPCTVLDPFIGSCTTGIVAYKHGRKFIGIDLSETYLKDIAIPRIEKETKQLKLFK